jgi:hypothetical protein
MCAGGAGGTYVAYIHGMKKLLLVICLPLVACVVGGVDGETPPGGDDDGGGSGSGSGSGGGSGVSNQISADETWSGTVAITASTTIDPGVTVTVAAGTTVSFASNTSLTVNGILDVQGTSASKVTIQPDGGAFFGSIRVETGGTLNLAYAVERGGSIITRAGSTVTITDSKLFGASHDLLIMNGGTVEMTNSQIGADPGTTDTTHCNFHFGGSGNTISVTKSNIIGTPFALMFYGGQNAIFTGNNWEEGANASADWIDSQPGVSGDFSGSFFAAGLPTAKAGATFTINNPAASRLLDAGIRP